MWQKAPERNAEVDAMKSMPLSKFSYAKLSLPLLGQKVSCSHFDSSSMTNNVKYIIVLEERMCPL